MGTNGMKTGKKKRSNYTDIRFRKGEPQADKDAGLSELGTFPGNPGAPRGLTSAEVQKRITDGKTNCIEVKTSKSIPQIIASNDDMGRTQIEWIRRV